MEFLQFTGIIILIILFFSIKIGKWNFALIFYLLLIIFAGFGPNVFAVIPFLILIPSSVILFINWKKNKNIEKAWDEYYEEIYDEVWDRDGGKCVKCSSDKDLDLDQIIPQFINVPDTDDFQLICQICSDKKVKYN
tara:strand:+ start:90 stop:497 length:408 start_codon:yes stop_codon:yes gene_type:complete